MSKSMNIDFMYVCMFFNTFFQWYLKLIILVYVFMFRIVLIKTVAQNKEKGIVLFDRCQI
jgi:hypothetical protein